MLPNETTPDGVPLKRCSKCKEWLPATSVYFRRNKLARSGFLSACKKCLGGNYAPPPSELRMVGSEGHRICVTCHQEKPLTPEFFYWRSQQKGLLQHECKVCTIERSKAHYAANTEQKKQYVAAWKRANSEKTLEYGRAARKRNPNRKRNIYWADPERYRRETRGWRVANPERSRMAKQVWRNANRERIRFRRQVEVVARRTRKKNLPNAFSANDWQRAIEYFHGCCAVCGRPPGLWHTLSMDHWIALTNPLCPGTIATNIVPLCSGIDGCNQAKHTKEAVQWLTKKHGKHKAAQVLKRIEGYFAWVREQDSHHASS